MKPAEHSFSGTDLCAWCPHFDHHDPALTYDNVCQLYDHLQHECLVAWSDGYDGFWILSRYVDIVTALMDSGQLFQDATHVELTVRKGTTENTGRWTPTEETRTVQGRYLIGADGANSFVRQHMETSITDLGFAFDWLVIDVIPREHRVWNPPALQVCDPVRPTTVVPGGKGRRRWEFMRLSDETVEELNRTERAWWLLAPWQMTPQNATLEQHTIYTFRAAWADSWRKGRLLLAGDAANLMPPFAGQGMGAGMRDAMNLVWKLDLVLSERTGDSLLDTYTSERMPNVQHFIGISMELGKIICITDQEIAASRDAQMLRCVNILSLLHLHHLRRNLAPAFYTQMTHWRVSLSCRARSPETGKRVCSMISLDVGFAC